MSTRTSSHWIARLCVGIAAVAGAAVLAAPANAADDVTLRLDWKIYGTHALFFAGEMKGFYKEEGLDLEIREGNGSAQVVKLMGAKGDTFAFAAGVTTLQAVTKGVPLKSVYGIMQKSPLSVMSLEAEGLAKPSDLVGKTVATSGGGSGTVLFKTFLKINGVNANDVKLAALGIGGRNQAVLARTAAAMVGYSVTDVPRMRLQGHKINVMHFADWGLPTVANGIIVNTETEAESPDLVRRFLRALTRSIEYAKDNRDEVVAYIVEKFPQTSRDSLRQELDWTVDLLVSESTKGKPPGWQADSDWAKTQEALVESKLIEEAMPLKSYFTNAYVPQ